MRGSRLHIFLGTVFGVLFILMSSNAAGEELSVGEEKHILINLERGLYISGSYLVSQENGEISELAGSFGWQYTFNNVKIDIGADHSLFGDRFRFGTFKPHGQISWNSNVSENQNINLLMRLDVTPEVTGVSDTLYYHALTITHTWRDGGMFTLDQSLRFLGQNGSLDATVYDLGILYTPSERTQITLRTGASFGSAGIENNVGVTFTFRH